MNFQMGTNKISWKIRGHYEFMISLITNGETTPRGSVRHRDWNYIAPSLLTEIQGEIFLAPGIHLTLRTSIQLAITPQALLTNRGFFKTSIPVHHLVFASLILMQKKVMYQGRQTLLTEIHNETRPKIHDYHP